MTSKVLAEVLTEQGGCKKDGDKLLVPDDTTITIFVGVGSSQLVVEKVAAVGIQDEIAVITTARKERYAIAYEDVRAVRFAANSSRAGYTS